MDIGQLVKAFNENEYIILGLTILSIIGFVISVATFIVALKFRDKIINYNEKNKFKNQQKNIVKKFHENYVSMHTDKIYQEFILENIILDITEFTAKYTFISTVLKKQLSATYDLISKVCLSEVKSNEINNRLKLCEYLTVLISLIEKEDTLL